MQRSMAVEHATDRPICWPDPKPFQTALRRLQQRFMVYAATSPAPLPATGLVVTSEIRLQCELYLPMQEIRSLFIRYYRASLPHEPILTSTPLYDCASWADAYATLPAWLQGDPSPARLLERLLTDKALHERFIFYSFLPGRFNGNGFGRYPDQARWLRAWAGQERLNGKRGLHLLDTACGSGEGTWELAMLLAAAGWLPEQIQLTGWTIEPLEVWAATGRCLPHADQRQAEYRQLTAGLIEQGWGGRLDFKVVDLRSELERCAEYQLILCNGLLGGPLLNEHHQIRSLVRQLADQLAPGGWLLADNRFHGGWQRLVSIDDLAMLFRQAGLTVELIGEGLGGCKS